MATRNLYTEPSKWELGLTSLAALLGGLGANLQGQSSAPHLAPLLQMQEQWKEAKEFKDLQSVLGPIAEKHPEMKAFVPLMRRKEFVAPVMKMFMELTAQESGGVPMSYITGTPTPPKPTVTSMPPIAMGEGGRESGPRTATFPPQMTMPSETDLQRYQQEVALSQKRVSGKDLTEILMKRYQNRQRAAQFKQVYPEYASIVGEELDPHSDVDIRQRIKAERMDESRLEGEKRRNVESDRRFERSQDTMTGRFIQMGEEWDRRQRIQEKARERLQDLKDDKSEASRNEQNQINFYQGRLRQLDNARLDPIPLDPARQEAVKKEIAKVEADLAKLLFKKPEKTYQMTPELVQKDLDEMATPQEKLQYLQDLEGAIKLNQIQGLSFEQLQQIKKKLTPVPPKK